MKKRFAKILGVLLMVTVSHASYASLCQTMATSGICRMECCQKDSNRSHNDCVKSPSLQNCCEDEANILSFLAKFSKTDDSKILAHSLQGVVDSSRGLVERNDFWITAGNSSPPLYLLKQSLRC